MNLVRLNKALSEAGITSRRKADRLIEMGLVQVNGKKVFEHGVKVNTTKDRIVVEGNPVTFFHKKLYVMFHKPKNVLTTLSDPEGRPTVGDYFSKFQVRLFPVGRLDWESEGLLLMTNDGDFSNSVMHPKEDITKTYLVKVNGRPEKKELDKLLGGVSIIGGKAKALHIEKVKRADISDQYDWFKIVISEGKNRQIRQMFAKIDMDVIKLQRVAIGRLKIGNLPRGEWTELSEAQIKKIYQPDLPEDMKIKKVAVNANESKVVAKPAKPNTKTKFTHKTFKPDALQKKKIAKKLFDN
jgi:23S rRNA pseudouridine2605 synthase